jgi:ribonuclease HI
MAKKQKYYVVWEGRKPGIFTSWPECLKQVKGYSGAQYKSFESREAAESAFAGKYEDYEGENVPSLRQRRSPEIGQPVLASYSVDASCIGNPGILEYRCVHTEAKEEVFKQGPFERGTNNIGEFLAIVDALALFKQQGITLPIYTDSRIAMTWVRRKKCGSKHGRDERNAKLFEQVRWAENWLRNNEYPNEVLKWKTETWGEIPADFGRK